MRAMILAAGRGERLRPITDRIPKALVDAGGVSLLERHLARVAAAGITDVVINLDWLGEQIVERVGDGNRYGLNVVYSPEFGHVLETAGGIQRALAMLGEEPFWVINADVYLDAPLPEVALQDDLDGLLLLVPTPAFKAKGDFGLVDGRVTNDALLTFSGLAVYHPRFFRDLPAGRAPLAPLLRQAAAAGRLGGAMLVGRWEDVGTPERLEKLRDSVGK